LTLRRLTKNIVHHPMDS